MSRWEVFTVTDGRPLVVVPCRRLAVLLSRRYGWDFARPGEGWETDPQCYGVPGLLRRFGARWGGQL